MDNYKIKVKDEAESKEIQRLFFALGFRWEWTQEKEVLRDPIPYLFTQGKNIRFGLSLTDFEKCVGSELTVAELQVLAAAKQPQDPALISGADALADITNIQHAYDDRDVWCTTQYSTLTIPEILKGETSDGRKLNFRLKPQTIKIELELPKPFEPKDGDVCFVQDNENEDGFFEFVFNPNSGFHKKYIQFGAWRTEDEIKKVVEQLRKIRGAS